MNIIICLIKEQLFKEEKIREKKNSQDVRVVFTFFE